MSVIIGVLFLAFRLSLSSHSTPQVALTLLKQQREREGGQLFSAGGGGGSFAEMGSTGCLNVF